MISEVNRQANAVLNSATQLFLRLLFPFILVGMVFFTVNLFAILLYGMLKSWLLPNALLSKSLYFDFSLRQPAARLNIVSNQNQWYLSKTRGRAINSTRQLHSRSKRFLRSGTSYSFDVVVTLSKSRKNIEMGKFMMALELIDAAGDEIARSSRPVAVPYQSDVTLFLDSVIKYPFRILGFFDDAETVTKSIHFIENYIEPSRYYPPTVELQFILSSADPDIVDAKVTVMPSLSGITYYMYYFPTLSFCVGVMVIAGCEFSGIVFFLSVRSIVRFFGNNPRAGVNAGEGGDGRRGGGLAGAHVDVDVDDEDIRAAGGGGRRRAGEGPWAAPGGISIGGSGPRGARTVSPDGDRDRRNFASLTALHRLGFAGWTAGRSQSHSPSPSTPPPPTQGTMGAAPPTQGTTRGSKVTTQQQQVEEELKGGEEERAQDIGGGGDDDDDDDEAEVNALVDDVELLNLMEIEERSDASPHGRQSTDAVVDGRDDKLEEEQQHAEEGAATRPNSIDAFFSSELRRRRPLVKAKE